MELFHAQKFVKKTGSHRTLKHYPWKGLLVGYTNRTHESYVWAASPKTTKHTTGLIFRSDLGLLDIRIDAGLGVLRFSL